jgi:hypothetical protein
MEKICPTCGHKVSDIEKYPRCPRCNTILKELPNCENCKKRCGIFKKDCNT